MSCDHNHPASIEGTSSSDALITEVKKQMSWLVGIQCWSWHSSDSTARTFKKLQINSLCKSLERELNEFIVNKLGKINYKYLAAGIVEYKIAKEKSLNLYDDVVPTLNKLLSMNMKLGILSDAPSREAWIRLYTLNLP